MKTSNEVESIPSEDPAKFKFKLNFGENYLIFEVYKASVHGWAKAKKLAKERRAAILAERNTA